MKPRRWCVYLATPTLTALGYVNAKHQPEALTKAWNRWPGMLDPERVQAGFVVRPYLSDTLPLGKLAPPVTEANRFKVAAEREDGAAFFRAMRAGYLSPNEAHGNYAGNFEYVGDNAEGGMIFKDIDAQVTIAFPPLKK